MKRLFAFALASALSCCLAYAQYRQDPSYGSLYDSETVSALKAHVSMFASAQMEGRKAGSEGERMSAAYLYEELEKAGVDMLCPKEGQIFGIRQENGDTLVSRNVYGFIQGYDKVLKNRFIVIGARMDNLGTNEMTVDGEKCVQTYYGANGNASGMAMLIELARKISMNSMLFRRSVIFVGFGASCASMAGSWYFLDRDFKGVGEIEAMIDLDMLGVPQQERMYAFTASNTDLNAILNTVSGGLQPVQPTLTSAEPYPSDHRAFYGKEIPSVLFTTGRYAEHDSPRDTPSILDYGFMERELEYIFNFAQTLSCTNHSLQFRQGAMDSAKELGGEKIYSYYDCDVKPMFLNNPDPAIFMSKWVYQYLKYPEQAVKEGIQGVGQVSFVIEKNGSVSNVKVFRGIDPLLDDEAVRVVSASPKWRPARVRGEKVRSTMTIGVEFRLARKGGKRRFGINGY